MNTGGRKIFLQNKESSKEIKIAGLLLVVILPVMELVVVVITSIKDIYGAGGNSKAGAGGDNYQYKGYWAGSYYNQYKGYGAGGGVGSNIYPSYCEYHHQPQT